MKKILFMIINMNIGGTEKALLNMLENMPRSEFDITLLMLEEYGGFLEYIPKDIKVKYLDYYVKNKDIFNNPPQKNAIKLIKKGKVINGISLLIIHILTKIIGERSLFYKYALKEQPKIIEEYDIAVAYAGPMDLISYFIINKVEAKKKVQWIHFDISKVGLNRKFSLKVFKKFHKIFIVSEDAKNKFISFLPEFTNKTQVFYNRISPLIIKKKADEGLGFEENYKGIRILTVGRLTQEKGQELCINVLRKLKEDGYEVKWYCIGEGNSRNLYEQIIKRYRLEDDFILLGAKSNPYPYMKQCDIYVQPSKHEGYCITLAEARCFDNPIIATNFSGANEQIINGKNGLIVNYNENEMYQAIKRIIEDKELKNNLSKKIYSDTVYEYEEINKLINI